MKHKALPASVLATQAKTAQLDGEHGRLVMLIWLILRIVACCETADTGRHADRASQTNSESPATASERLYCQVTMLSSCIPYVPGSAHYIVP